MQWKKILIVIGFCVAAVLGWGALMKDNTSAYLDYQEELAHADEWMEMGLYQRAIAGYQSALSYKSTPDVWKKICRAGKLRWEEDMEFFSDYCGILQSAIASCPDEAEFYRSIAEAYCKEEEYKSAYEYCSMAVDRGSADKNIEEEYMELKYKNSLIDVNCQEIHGYTGDSYTVQKDGTWRRMSAEGVLEYQDNYAYLSPAGEEGIRIYTTEQDSRLINEEGTVLGIFKDKVQQAGIFSEDRIMVREESKCSYYDSFAQKVFGGYEEAGTFQNGSAAVLSAGKWFVVDKNGEKTSEDFAEIILDGEGCYNAGKVILAAKEPGKYQIYDEEWKPVGDFTCDDMDIVTEDGCIAFEKGGKWGFVDVAGNILIEPQYENARSFSNGLAAVCQNNRWGFINRDNQLVIEYQFMDADYFNSHGSCFVRTDGMYQENADEEANEADTGEVDEAETGGERQRESWQLLMLELGIL